MQEKKTNEHSQEPGPNLKRMIKEVDEQQVIQ